MFKKSTCAVVMGALVLVIAVMSYKFIISGSVQKVAGERQAIILDSAERELVLGEMRMFLSAVQKITKATADEDMERVAKAAREVGLAAQQAVPGALMGKLPMSFKRLGYDTHSKFDALALDAESLADPMHTLGQLSELMNNCVSCHSTYQIPGSVKK